MDSAVEVPAGSDLAREVAALEAAGARYVLEPGMSLNYLFLTLPDAVPLLPGWSVTGTYDADGRCLSRPDDWSAAWYVLGLEGA